MVFEHTELEKRVNEVYGTPENFAEESGISGIRKKLDGEMEFTITDIYKSTDLLTLTKNEVNKFFFTERRD